MLATTCASVCEVIDTLLSAKELRSKSIPEHERQFQLAAALLRTEVKERFQKKLYKYLAGEVEDEFQDDVRCALEEQSAELLRVALQRRHPCPMDHALHEAVRQGNCDAARLLLENSAEPNDRCLALDHGEFPLQLALSSNLGTGEMVRLGRSEESQSVALDRCQMVELLLDARADVGQRRNDAEGHTPLHDGVRRGDPGVVALLLRHQADPNATNAFGEAPLELAARGSFYTDVRDSFSLVEVLLQWGACPLLPGAPGPFPRTSRSLAAAVLW
eukprot:g24268.t1